MASGKKNERESYWAGRKYYMGGKSYEPDKAKLLCRHVIRHNESIDLEHLWGYDEIIDIYITNQNQYFRVSGIPGKHNEVVNVIDRDTALHFMDLYASEIIIENYDDVFGVPEEG